MLGVSKAIKLKLHFTLNTNVDLERVTIKYYKDA
jgi:hypothetical protein